MPSFSVAEHKDCLRIRKRSFAQRASYTAGLTHSGSCGIFVGRRFRLLDRSLNS